MAGLLRRNRSLLRDWASADSDIARIKTSALCMQLLGRRRVDTLLMEAGGRLSGGHLCTEKFLLLLKLDHNSRLDEVVLGTSLFIHQDDFLFSDREQNLVGDFRKIVASQSAAKICLGRHRPLT